MKIKGRHLDARKEGEFAYDYKHDILFFKIKDRDYLKSIDFDNLIVDIDKEQFITGLRIMDASKLFNMSKVALKNLSGFEFNARIEDKIVSIQLRFTSVLRNKPIVRQGQDFIREAVNTDIKDSEIVCTVGV